MKHLLKTLILIISCFTLFSSQANGVKQDGGEIPLIIPTPPGNNPHAPAVIPISCYLMSSPACVVIQSSSITTHALVVIENTTTGVLNQENILISTVPSTVNISGPGKYTINITLQSGAVYYGQFLVYL